MDCRQSRGQNTCIVRYDRCRPVRRITYHMTTIADDCMNGIMHVLYAVVQVCTTSIIVCCVREHGVVRLLRDQLVGHRTQSMKFSQFLMYPSHRNLLRSKCTQLCVDKTRLALTHSIRVPDGAMICGELGAH
jgi:hypothetical protein